MATSANRFIQDQNLSSLYNGVTPLGKTNVAKPVKKGGGLGGRKALNDISNARNTTNIPQTKKQNPTNSIIIEKDSSAGRGFSKSKVPEKGKVGGRKALGDLTNSVKPASQRTVKTARKLGVVSENVPGCIADEGFLHNHNECIKSQNKAPDVDYFLKSTGLNTSIPASRGFLSPSKKYEGYSRHLEMEELPELSIDEVDWCNKSELLGYFSPACRSPQSPKLSRTSWGEDHVCDLMVIASP